MVPDEILSLAGDCISEQLLPVPVDAGEPEDFAGPDCQIDVGQIAGVAIPMTPRRRGVQAVAFRRLS